MAHTPNVDGRWHVLLDHLEGTARRARAFAEPFGSGDLAEFVGLLHDVGKCSDIFGAYLTTCASRGDSAAQGAFPSRDHKRAGALLASERGGEAGVLLAGAILGHHGGMPDLSDTRPRMAEASGDEGVLDSAARGEAIVAQRLGRLVPQLPSWATAAAETKAKSDAVTRDIEMLIRLVFSALVDADFLDTEEHFSPPRPHARLPSDLGPLRRRFEQRHSNRIAAGAQTDVNAARTEIFAEVLGRADFRPNIYSLTAPTGSGKTLIGLGWALAHAEANSLRRVVTAVPFITVTDQVAAVYREMLEDSESRSVLEHHSQVDSENWWRKLATENWDAPVVVTTTVQLFESLFSNRPSACRKLHRLASSVIILDEVQALPIEVLEPVIDGLRSLVDRFGASVLLMTATQPAVELLEALGGRAPPGANSTASARPTSP